MGKSILQTEKSYKSCYFCGTTIGLEQHHVFHGSRRQLADKHGLTVWLCREHHTGPGGVHNNIDMDRYLERIGQKKFEETHSHEEWMRIFGKNYL